MLAGNLTSGRAFMWQGDLEPMAHKKFENFSEFYQLYPEFKHVFVGDNGQGDVRAAELIVDKFGPDALEAAFFQRVQPMEKMFNYHSRDDLERWRKMNIVFFDTYVGAALEAFRMKKIRLAGLKKICDEAGQSFEAIHSWLTPQSRERARIMLNRDLAAANKLMPRSLRPSPLVMKPQTIALNATVRTPMGRGIVRKFRGLDGIYQVDLTDWPPSATQKRVQAFFTEQSLTVYVSTDISPLARSSLHYVKFYRAQPAPVLAPHTLVKTLFGIGRVLRYRAEDEVYTVSIPGDHNMLHMTAFMSAESLQPVDDAFLKSYASSGSSSPRMFAGVRSGFGFITKKLSSLVPVVQTPGPLAVGSRVGTAYGKGVVCSFRAVDGVYAVTLTDWALADGQDVMAYLTQDCIDPGIPTLEATPTTSTKAAAPPGSGRLFQLFRFSAPAAAVVPYAAEAGVKREIDTVFGLASTAMSQPYRGCLQATLVNPDLHGAVAYVQASEAEDTPVAASSRARRNTLELLVSPFSYLLAGSSEDDEPPKAADAKTLFPKGSLVSTPFGEGTVRWHRGSDDIYLVDLPTMQGYFRVSSLQRPVRGVVGQPVDTVYGSSVLEQVREEDGVHVVVLRLGLTTSEARAYLHPSNVMGPIKASRGDVVMTPFGSGVVMQFRSHDGFYRVALDWDSSGQSHTSAYISEGSLVRAGPVENSSSGCVVM